MTFAFALAFLAIGQAQDAEFADILKRFEADEPALREAASRDLDRYVKKLGDGGAAFLRARVAETSGEVQGRLQNRLDEFVRIENAWKTLRALDALDLPDLKDKKLVLYNIGSHWTGGNNQWGFQYEAGWLLEESKDQVRIFNLYGQTLTHARKFDPFKEWEKARPTWPKDRPLPTEYLDVDFEKACARVCLPERNASGGEPFDSCFFPATGWSLHTAFLARWALQRGYDRKAFELLEAGAAAALRDRDRDRREKHIPYSEVVALLVCGHLRTDALMSLEPRPALLKAWLKIKALAPTFREGEADKMIPAYEHLIAEDQAWKEPEKPGGAEYWIHHLRDVAARQWSDPGSCDVLENWHEDKKLVQPYPPKELVKLGWDALPAIIEHLDDTRPTRSVGWHRSFNPSSYYLLHVGDCCQQIFEAITGFDIYRARSTSGAMVKDGDAPDAKAKARKWWAENKDKGPEQFFISALDKPDMAGNAARKLLEMNAEKHIPRLIAILAKSESSERNAILGPLGPHLKKEHQKLVEDALVSHDPQFLSTATSILWKQFQSDRGALALIDRFKAIPGEDRDTWHWFWALRGVRSDVVAAGLRDLMRSKNVGVRVEAYGVAIEFPHALLAAELVAQLSDTELTGWSSDFPIRYCDEAARTLCRMAALGDRFALSGTPEVRDKTLQDLKKWWDQEGSSVDWKGLLQKLEEAERPEPPGKK